MKIKDGVIMSGLQLPMRKVLMAADVIWRGHHAECVVTSAIDGDHSAGSLHYYGYAVDFRIGYFPLDVIESICLTLQQELGNDYRVLNEGTHVHVEYRRVLNESG